METPSGPSSTNGRMPSFGIDLDEFSAVDHQRVLIIDDEPDTVFLLKSIVRSGGFDVISAYTGSDAIKKCKAMNPDLVLLDLMMPEMDGWQTLRFLREMSDIPVIIISSIASKKEVVRALQIGVDDFLSKPFFNAEVVARIRTVLRRSTKPQKITRFVFPQARLMIDLSSQEVKLEDHEIHLTPKEFAVLSSLAKKAPGIVSYGEISRTVWGEESQDAYKRTKYLIYLLRRKFTAINPTCNIILNIDRLGYKLQTEESLVGTHGII